MKYLITLTIIFFNFISFAQGYIQVKENEPFRRADMIVVQSDTIPNNTFSVVAKTLVKHGFILDKLMPEYGIITTDLRESRIVQMKLYVFIDESEIRVSGSYNSLAPLGMQTIAGISDSKTMILDYRNDLSIYYDEMTEIATTIKEKINAKKLLHVERGLTTKF